jgi:hypothetical protein
MAFALRKVLPVSLIAFGVMYLASCGGGGGAGPPAPQPSVSVTPRITTVFDGQSIQFKATLIATPSFGVTWSVNGVTGGNSTVGSIDVNGLYLAPAVAPSPNTVTVSATTISGASLTGTATVTISNPKPSVSSISPIMANAGSTDTPLMVTGSGFTPQSTVMLGAVSLVTTVNSSTQLTAVVPAAMLATAGGFPVTVRTPPPGGGTSAAVNLNVLVVVAISPSISSLIVGQTQQFSATVTGSSNQNVSWSVKSAVEGNATAGTIDPSGLYTAPAIPNSVAVTATSAADTTRTASASVIAANPAPSISGLSPVSLIAGSGDSSLTVNGAGFAQQSVVRMAGTSLVTASSGYPRILLLEGLSATGYERDSTYALALTRGSFPFALFDEDSSTGTVTPYHVMEYPLDISGDQVPILDSTTINNYLAEWETVIKFNYDNNTPTILLLHPIDTQIRFQALQQLITDLRNQGLDLWIGDLKTFSQFWESQGVTNASGW